MSDSFQRYNFAHPGRIKIGECLKETLTGWWTILFL